MSRYKRKGSSSDINSKVVMIEERLEAGLENIKNQLGTGHKNPEAVSSLIDKINQLESSIKSSLREVKIALEEHIDKQKKPEHENGIALFGIPEGDTRTLPDTIANFISAKFKIEVTVADIYSCYRLGTGARAVKKGKHPRPVALYFVNRWRRDKVFFAKSNIKGSGVVMSEILTENALQLYKQTKTILGAKIVWTWRGDFNIDLLDFESAKARYVTDIIEGFGMKQLVKQPTRITENTATLIDYIVVTNEEIVSDVGTIHAAEVSDHELIYCIIDIIVKQKQSFVTTRNFKNLNYYQFQSDMQSIPWSNIYELNNADSKATFIADNINKLLDLHVPLETDRITKRYAPWLNSTLKEMMMLRDHALKVLVYKITQSFAHWKTYLDLRNLVNIAVRREKCAYFRTKLDNRNNSIHSGQHPEYCQSLVNIKLQRITAVMKSKGHIKIECAVVVGVVAGIRILPKSEDDYRKAIRLFKDHNVPHHTFFFFIFIRTRNWNSRATSPNHIIRIQRSGVTMPMPLAMVISSKIENRSKYSTNINCRPGCQKYGHAQSHRTAPPVLNVPRTTRHICAR
nr:unnamed protein product [Callosobruchus analis]